VLLTKIVFIPPLPFGSIYTFNSSTKAQFEIKTICAMTKSIHTILTPLLIMSYLFGLRIAISSHSKLWFSTIYILLFWSVYYFLTLCAFTSFYEYLSFVENIGHRLEISVTILLIIGFGIYHNKVTNNYNNKLKNKHILIYLHNYIDEICREWE